jgi:hypothetical protein
MSFQLFLALKQFISQSLQGLAIEAGRGGWVSFGFDENTAVFRVSGSLLFHNQLGLVTAVVFAIILPYLFTLQRYLPILFLLITLIIIALTQSRSAFLGLTAVLLYSYFYFRTEWANAVNTVGKKRMYMYCIALLVLTSHAIVPRILLLGNFIHEGAGGPYRFRLIQEGSFAFFQSPMLGYGIGTNEYILNSFFPKGTTFTSPAAVHFAPLQLLLEIGIIGLVSFTMPFYIISRRIFIEKFIKSSQLSKEKKDLSFIFLGGVSAFALYYSVLPHVGFIEFSYLGLVFGFGLLYHYA